jgi:exocyst complex component 2
MALDIIKTYSGILSQYFTLSDFALAEASSKKDGGEVEAPPFVPPGTTVLAACFYAEKIVEEVSDCAVDLGAVDISSEAGTALKGLLDSLRWRFEEVIAATWARGE